MTIDTELISGRTLIPDNLFRVVVDRAITDFGVAPEMAPRVVDQALAFLATAGRTSDSAGALTPSVTVDPGWHAFMLYSRPYREFCDRVAGRFIDHVPHDDPTAPPSQRKAPGRGVASTMEAIAAAGFAVDQELWLTNTAKCGQCHEDGNCGASGADGNENTDTRDPGP